MRSRVSFHTRCRRCDHRQALSKPLEQYTRQPHCRVCGGALRPDKWMNKRNSKVMTCTFDGHGPDYHSRIDAAASGATTNRTASGNHEQFAAEQALLDGEVA